MDTERTVASHYTQGCLLTGLLDALEAADIDPHRLTPADLAPLEEFHIGGRGATAHLAEHMELGSGMRLLDIGSGVGGAARYFALEHGCSVVGIDLTEEFCAVGNELSARVGLDGATEFVQGSALELPFADASFDGAYMLHVGMNIEDKERLIGETARVLRRGGQFAVYDILEGSGGDPLFPAPWAMDASTSFLVSIDKLGALLERGGFEIVVREDRTEAGNAFFAELAAAREAGNAPPLTPAVLMGESGPARLANAARSLGEGRISAWLVIGRKAG